MLTAVDTTIRRPPVRKPVIPIKWAFNVEVVRIFVKVIDKEDGKEKTIPVFKRTLYLTCKQGYPIGPSHYKISLYKRYAKSGIIKFSVAGRIMVNRPWWEGEAIESSEWDKPEYMNIEPFFKWLSAHLGDRTAIAMDDLFHAPYES